jgi:hypothetical protein
VRAILISAGTVAAALTLVAAVVFGARDSALFVSPPEAVAEGFGRQLASARYDLSRSYLSSDARRLETARVIEERFEPVRRRIGVLNHAEATERWSDGDRASAMCELQGEHGTVALKLVLTREHGLWAVESWEPASEISR